MHDFLINAFDPRPLDNLLHLLPQYQIPMEEKVLKMF